MELRAGLIFLLALSVVAAQTHSIQCDEKCSKVLGIVNEERRKRGLGTVCINSRLMRAAEKHSRYQASIDTMSHTGAGGSTVGDRVKAERYDYRQVGENVAVGYSGAKNIMMGWMNSPDHKKNIVNPDYVHMGIAWEPNGNYWTQVFGTPQRTGGGCNVDVPGGQFGTTYGRQVGPYRSSGPQCTGLCSTMVDMINEERGWGRMAPLCTSGKLMRAAKEIVDKGYMQQNRNDKIETTISDTGYTFKAYALSSLSVWSTGRLRDEDIIDMFSQQLPQSRDTLMGDWSHLGVASDSAKENWIVVYASTWDPDADRCQNGRAAMETGTPYGMIAKGDVHGRGTNNGLSHFAPISWGSGGHSRGGYGHSHRSHGHGGGHGGSSRGHGGRSSSRWRGGGGGQRFSDPFSRLFGGRGGGFGGWF